MADPTYAPKTEDEAGGGEERDDVEGQDDDDDAGGTTRTANEEHAMRSRSDEAKVIVMPFFNILRAPAGSILMGCVRSLQDPSSVNIRDENDVMLSRYGVVVVVPSSRIYEFNPDVGGPTLNKKKTS